MKVLDHVPPTMETFVKHIFEIIDMPGYGCGVADFYPGATPGYWIGSASAECWDEQGAYDFDVYFRGDARKPYWDHTLTVRLDIDSLYNELRIKWETTIGEIMEPQGLRKYWPGCVPALHGFIAQTYLSSLDDPVAAQRLQEFVAAVTE